MNKIRTVAVNIKWDTDGENIDLPEKIIIPNNIKDDIDAISDYISDKTGFCHNGFSITHEAYQPLTFRMYFSIKFNRPVNKDKDYIDIGSYTMQTNNKTIQFDFMETNGFIDKNDNTIVTFECKDIDYDTFPESNFITEADLEQITKISEIIIDTNESSCDLMPVKLMSLAFVLPYNNYKTIVVSDQICHSMTI